MLKWITNRRKGEENIETVHQVVIGEPQATETCTVEQLKSMGHVGLYTVVSGDNDQQTQDSREK